jgi:acyl carrier protein
MTREEILTALNEELGAILGWEPNAHEGSDLDVDFGIDSLDKTDLAVRLTARLKAEIDSECVGGSVGRLVTYIEEKVQ